MVSVGVLALQGDIEAHHRSLLYLNATPYLVRRAEDLQQLSGLVLPGGESSSLLKLLTPELKESIKSLTKKGMPLLATCAGTILIAEGVDKPAQESLQLLDIDVERNSYGRQIDSFIEPHLSWTKSGKNLLQSFHLPEAEPIEGVFIRAPRITRTGPEVEVLIEMNQHPVLVRQDHILAASFHPELSQQPSMIHQLFLRFAENYAANISG